MTRNHVVEISNVVSLGERVLKNRDLAVHVTHGRQEKGGEFVKYEPAWRVELRRNLRRSVRRERLRRIRVFMEEYDRIGRG